jgi:hypothetical protein
LPGVVCRSLTGHRVYFGNISSDRIIADLVPASRLARAAGAPKPPRRYELNSQIRPSRRPRYVTRNGAREASGVSVCQTKEPRTRKTTRPADSQNEFHRCRRNPREEFRRDPYQKVMG